MHCGCGASSAVVVLFLLSLIVCWDQSCCFLFTCFYHPHPIHTASAARALYPLIAKTVAGETYAFEAMKGKVGLVSHTLLPHPHVIWHLISQCRTHHT
jgi:hypothetical protein